MINKMSGIKGKEIHGVVIKKLGQLHDERGAVYHMLRNDDEIFDKFGEIYFSMVYPGAVKGWHLHEKMTLNYTTIVGMIKLVLYDDRENSPTKGNLMEIFMGEKNYLLVKIPPKVWNGFKGIGRKEAIVANCSDIPHDPSEIKRLEPFTKKIPYDWELTHE